MSYTNSTEHFGYPLPVETDLFNGLDDNAMKEDIDEKLYNLIQTSQDDHAAVTQLASDVQELGQTVAGYDQTIESMQGTLTEHAERLILLTNRQTELSRQLGAKAGEATIAEAYNEEAGYSKGDMVYHSNILYEAKAAIVAPAGDFDSSKWDIVVLSEKILGASSAGNISYNNAVSGLDADDVQEAIDKVNANFAANGGGTAVDVGSLGTSYTFPSDGYIRMWCYYDASTGAQASVAIDFANGSPYPLQTMLYANGTNQAAAIFVKKGMSVTANLAGTGTGVFFIPLV